MFKICPSTVFQGHHRPGRSGRNGHQNDKCSDEGGLGVCPDPDLGGNGEI